MRVYISSLCVWVWIGFENSCDYEDVLHNSSELTASTGGRMNDLDSDHSML